MAATNLLDLMSEKDRALMLERYKRRMEGGDPGSDRISREMYLLAEFSYYLGYGGVEAVRENKITLEEMYALLEGLRKVWYVKLVEQARAQQVSTGSVLAKSPNTAFSKGIKPYVKRSEL
jgi:hypothetical protein